jgi:spermidine synthase
VAAFGLVEVAIGVAALGVTVLMRDLPTHATQLQGLFLDPRTTEFGARQGASFAVALAYMLGPAFLMGVAFPLAAAIHAGGGDGVGGAVGRVLTWNTVGSILGAAASGFALIYAFGIERSLQMLAALNAGLGLVVVASLAGRAAPWAAAAATAALLVALGASTTWGRFWDMKYFAVFRNNQREAFNTAFKREDALQNTDVLYYFEGVNETISVIRPKGSMKAFVVNARPEASTAPMDVQCQRTLGHLPMLLHPNPRRVFVLGTGTGMTLGATAAHPEAERIVLAEIEPGAIGAARAFADYNHGAVDDPKVHLVFDDGRNYLRTTEETFDVVTADPIHPWSGGAAYLYTREYFRSVAGRLALGGIAAQWLPIYELTPRDIRTVVRTWAEAFPHTLLWLTHYDAELVGSKDPIVVDEEELARRLARPEIAGDLAPVEMGTAEDFLSYFVLGTERARELGRGGVVNTDDNLALEFSAPASQGVGWLMGANAADLAGARESLLPYLAPARSPEERARQVARWERNLAAARAYDPAHALLLWGRGGTEEFARQMQLLAAEHPGYAPYRFLRREVERAEAGVPRLAGEARFPVAAAGRGERTLVVSAVTVRAGDTRTAVMLVDNDRREILGQRYLDGSGEELEAAARRSAAEALRLLGQAYEDLEADARRRGDGRPSEVAALARFKERIASWAAGAP